MPEASRSHCRVSYTLPVTSKGALNIHSTYYENFLALSVGLRVNKHQLKMDDHTNQAPVLRYRDITITSESLRESLAAVCPVLGVHNVARVRRGTLPLFEVDFADQVALGKFCNNLDGKVTRSTSIFYSFVVVFFFVGKAPSRLHDQLESKLFPGLQLEVTLKLHLIMPNADKKDPQLREVTSGNYKECFTLIRESALFEFGVLDLTHPIPPDEDSGRRELGKDCSFASISLNDYIWYTIVLQVLKTSECFSKS